METLDYTKDKDIGESPLPQQAVYLPDPMVIEVSCLNMTDGKTIKIFIFFYQSVGTLQGEVRDMDFESESEEEEEEQEGTTYVPKNTGQQKKQTGIFSLFKYKQTFII